MRSNNDLLDEIFGEIYRSLFWTSSAENSLSYPSFDFDSKYHQRGITFEMNFQDLFRPTIFLENELISIWKFAIWLSHLNKNLLTNNIISILISTIFPLEINWWNSTRFKAKFLTIFHFWITSFGNKLQNVPIIVSGPNSTFLGLRIFSKIYLKIDILSWPQFSRLSKYLASLASSSTSISNVILKFVENLSSDWDESSSPSTGLRNLYPIRLWIAWGTFGAIFWAVGLFDEVGSGLLGFTFSVGCRTIGFCVDTGFESSELKSSFSPIFSLTQDIIFPSRVKIIG